MVAEQHTDIVIIGAGLVGLTAAIALAKQGRSVVLVDAHARPKALSDGAAQPIDSRVYALTRQTIAWLAEIGVWSQVPAARVQAISAMHLWSPAQAHAEPSLTLAADTAHLPDLGVMIEAKTLAAACWQVLDHLPVEVLSHTTPSQLLHTPTGTRLRLSTEHTLTAQLVLGADGGDSWVRSQAGLTTHTVDFAQTALVTHFKADTPHAGIARQWFAAHETLALLPLPQQVVSLVWALPNALAQPLAQGDSQALAEAVRLRTGDVLGPLQAIAPIHMFPLRQQTASAQVKAGLMLLGDAAHQIHPMAGQGANLGFEDVMTLCDALKQWPAMRGCGDWGLLKHVARARKLAALKLHTVTRGLDALFARPEAAWTHLALLGLHGISQQPALQRWLIQAAEGARKSKQSA